MRGWTLARGLWFGIPGGGLLLVSATCKIPQDVLEFVSAEIRSEKQGS